MSRAEAEVNAEVAIVIPNWRSYEETRACIEACHRLSRPARLYLVDNESDRAALAELHEVFPRLRSIPLEQNHGFAPAMNRGLHRALEEGATHLLLLNNDTRVTPRLLERLLEVFAAHPDAGLVAPVLESLPPDGRVQSAGIDVNRTTGRILLRCAGTARDLLPQEPHPVDAASGAALLIRAEVLRKIGLLDPDYYFYFEDVELCLRAREQGYTTWLDPRAVVLHRGGATMGRSPEQVYYAVRNQLRVIQQRGRPLPPPLDQVREGFVVALHLGQLLRGARVRAGEGLPWLSRGIRDYRDGRLGPVTVHTSSGARVESQA